jgi:hypothetical protein
VNDSLTGADRAVPNTSLVFNDPSDAGAPDPPGAQKTITGDLLSNDTDQDRPPQTLMIQPVTAQATADTGTVDIEADGDFTYHPKPGCSDNQDSFSYSVSDGNATTQATVTVNLIATCPWYVDNSLGTNGDGTSRTPFNTLTNVNGFSDVDASGNLVFLYEGSGSYSGGLALESSQKLFGESHGLTVPDGSGGMGTTTLVAADPGNPTIANATGHALELASGTEVQGVNLGSTPAGSAALSASSGGTLTVGNVTAGTINNTTGKAVDISTGNLIMGFASVSSSGSSSDAVRLDNTAGTFTAGAGTLQNATDQVVDINGNGAGDNVNFTYGGSISDSTGTLISITNQTGGTKDFNGTVSGGFVSVTNNDSAATVRFDGGLTLSSGSSNALHASNGGTLAVTNQTGGFNTLTTTSGTALNVVNTSIHDDDLTFRSITSNGASSGVVLNSTSNADGRLVVTGNGGTCNGTFACTGGAIQSPFGPGISLTSVPGGASLTRVAVTNGSDDAIRASTIAGGFVLANSWLANNGNQAGERGLDFTNVAGTSSISSSLITGSAADNARWENDSGTLGLSVTGSTFSSNSFTNGGDGLLLLGGNGTPTMTAQLTGNTFQQNRDDGFQLTTSSPSSATMNATLIGNTVTQGVTSAADNAAVRINPGDASQTKVKVDNNNLSGSLGSSLVLNPGADSTTVATYDAIVTNNSIGTAAADSGSVSGAGIRAQAAGNGTNRFEIRGNALRHFEQQGMYLSGDHGSNTTDYTVTGNSISDPDGTGLRVLLESGSVGTDTTNLCVDFGGAGTLANSVATGGSPADIRVRRESASSELELRGYPPASDVQAYLRNRNTPGTLTASVSGPAPTGTNSSCALPAGPPSP